MKLSKVYLLMAAGALAWAPVHAADVAAGKA